MPIKEKILGAAVGVTMALAGPAAADLRNIDAETQASINLAEAFYEDVLVYRNLDNFDKYIGDTYIQHATAYGDGPEAMLAAVTAELNADPDVQVSLYRTIAEGNYVAIHSVWTASSGEEYVYVDIWRAEGGKLVEHWDHYQQAPADPANNNTMYQGPDADIYTATQDVERNRERAIAVLNTFGNPGDTSAITNYVSAETYIQHNPYVPNGRDAFVGYLDELAASNTRFDTLIGKTIAMGDMVLVHSKQTNPDKAGDLGTGYMDIFRFDDAGLIVEHWDIEEAQTGESANDNDVFGYPAD